MDPIFSGRQLVQSLGQFVVIVVSGLAVYKGFSELTADSFYQPVIQGLIGALAILGFSRVGAKNGDAPK
jgi:hypothetical protein